ncbi:hypothetical protein [Streptomyces violascens]|uniref:HTH luxR-type domain-containing protein n=1 Tax=Streptomyces violascens TaxID=67381 RepID=A0ABQ3QS80_9ACTN|nr:hypothetical protein [Streptomyces violascens]GGU51524.1 hypothetical protein GCM10010289_84880 [Streptomyces violascens]GHI40099.1 hypothetical protein Sviol_45070 [Streptomyces violascens]
MLLAHALTAARIGRRLGITTCNANKRIENIYRKLGTATAGPKGSAGGES